MTGIDGAKSLQVAPVRDAINDFSCFMNEYGVGSVAAFLHLLWVGNGGDESLFPFSLSSKAILDDEAWNYLLSIENLNDQTFWDNLNVDISLQQLIRLNVREYPDAFNRLMRSKASSTKVKAVKLVKTQSSFNNDDSGVWKWGVDLGRLCIYCRQWVAYFSIDVDSLDDCGDSESIMSDSGLFARDFQKLTKGKTVKRVTIENGDSVSISNIPNDNIDDSHSLKLFRKSRRNSAHVVSSSFHIDGASGGVVEVDFVNHFAYVKSRRLPSLRDLIQSTIPVLLGLNTGVSNSLDDLFSDYDPQGVLFA